MRALWPDAKVLDAALKVSIGEIRKALGDHATQSKFIETVGTKGYRFIAPISLRLSGNTAADSLSPVVGRASELEQLRSHLELANQGKRQIVFVTGEPGIGKTTLIELFIQSIASDRNLVVALGQCIEQYGAGEAFMPILDALEKLCKSTNGSDLIEVLRGCAPSWLLNLPGLVSPEERAALARQTQGTTPERRLREITAFLEEIAKTQTVVLILEDLHWLDPSSLALISFLARRRDIARLMMIGTYRTAEVERLNNPLKNVAAELTLHKFCIDLPLTLLSRDAVGEYLAARFASPGVSEGVLSTVYQRSEGNPLFMVNVTDYLVGRQAIVRDKSSVTLAGRNDQHAVPSTIRDLIERQVSALSRQDQELLETASIQGATFSVAVIAGVLNQPRDEIEIRFRDLAATSHLLQGAGSRRRPNGGGTALYKFAHALYQNVIYDRIDAAKRRRLHQAAGERTEAAYQDATEQVAAELAMHFERAGDSHRAAKYLLASAQIATQQNAYQEAMDYCECGLGQLQACEDSMERREMEMGFHLLTGVSLTSMQGFASLQVKAAFSRAQTLTSRIANDGLLFQTLAGIWSYNLLRGELRDALKIAVAMLGLARRSHDWSFRLHANLLVGCSHFYLGDIRKTHAFLIETSSDYELERYQATNPRYSWDPGIVAACYDAMALWILGYPSEAEQAAQKAQAFATALRSPYHSAVAAGMLSVYYVYRNDIDTALEVGSTALAISSEHGFPHWLACGKIIKGWALVRKGNHKEGPNLLAEGIANWESTGAQMLVPTYRLLQAEAHLAFGDAQKAMTVVEQCLTMSHKNHESYYDAEFYRTRGELRLATKKQMAGRPNYEAAEADILRAIQTSRRQKAKSLELRSTLSLCSLWQKTGKAKEAKRMLTKIYGWFTEGFDTPDLKAAKALLDQLS